MPPAKPEPGRDQEMAERTQRLNVVFALSSIALLVTLSLMIWADYNREWKQYQLTFNKLEVERTRGLITEADGKVDKSKRDAAAALLAKGQGEVAARRDDLRTAEKEFEKLDGEWYRIDQNFRFTKAQLDVDRYNYEEAVDKKHGNVQKVKKVLDDREKELADYRRQLEDVIARKDAAAARIRELKTTVLQAEQAQKELLGEKTRLEESLRKIEPGFVSLVRNLPVLDLANPSLKINQIMPAALTDDVIFTGTPKVDRCTTCHLGIDKKGYEKAPQPFTSHPDIDLYLRGGHPIEKIGCTGCHQGRGRATSFQKAAHTPDTKKKEEDWGKFTGSKEYHPMHYWDLPMMAKGHTESQCAKCHQGTVEVPKADRLNAGVFLVEKYGCFGCHKIKGWENLRKVGPDLTKVTAKTNEEWIFRWIKEPKSFRPTRMPQIWDVRVTRLDEKGEPVRDTAEQAARNDVEANAVVAYLVDKSGREPYPPAPRGDLAAGRKTFESVGCLACHRIGNDHRGIPGLDAAAFRTHGPNLDGTGSKVNEGWLYAWIRNPKSYWHDTRMPNLRLTEKEAADLTAYLMSLKNDPFTAKPRPPLDPALRDTILKEYFLDLFTLKQADEKMAALDDRGRTLALGEKTIGRYGCFGCHVIAGFEKTSPIGVELTEEGSKLVERLDFGFEASIPHTLPAWVHRKLMEPRVFDRDKSKKPGELLRMPKFHLAPEEADAIVTAILSLTKEQVPAAAQKQLSPDEKYVEKGARLIRDYNCQGCHQIGAQGGTIRAVIESNLETSGGDTLQTVALSPPLLYNPKSQIGEGARVQTPWLHGFLLDPSNKIRPWLEIRMPTFEFTEEQVNSITRYFAAMDKVPYPYDPKPALDPVLVAQGQDLFGKWQCIKCHVVGGKLPNQEPANMAPDLAKVPERLRADWLSAWFANPARIQPGTRMPMNFPDNPQENAYPDILGGDQKKQIEAVRSYLLSLGGTAKAARGTEASKPGAP